MLTLSRPRRDRPTDPDALPPGRLARVAGWSIGVALGRVLRCLRLAPGGQTGSAAIALCCGSRGLAGGKASRKLRDRPARKPLGIRSAVSASRAAASASLQRSSTGGADFG